VVNATEWIRRLLRSARRGLAIESKPSETAADEQQVLPPHPQDLGRRTVRENFDAAFAAGARPRRSLRLGR